MGTHGEHNEGGHNKVVREILSYEDWNTSHTAPPIVRTKARIRPTIRDIQECPSMVPELL
jgi:hypothetical protein